MTARIYTVFEFLKSTPEGRINYRRHLAAGNSFDEAKAAVLARDFLRADSCAFMTSQDAAEACRYEVEIDAHSMRDLQGLTHEEFHRWVKMQTKPSVIDGQFIAPSHALIHGERYVP